MLEKPLRPLLQPRWVDPAARLCIRLHISPQRMTLVSLIAGCGAAFAIAHSLSYLALLLLLLSGYADMLDGTIARFSTRTSAQGAVLDIVSDRAVEFALVAGLCGVDPLLRSIPCLWMLGSILLCVTSFLVVGIFTENASEKSFHYSAGWMERPEAFAFFAMMILFPLWFAYLAWSFTFLVFCTALIRVWEFSQNH